MLHGEGVAVNVTGTTKIINSTCVRMLSLWLFLNFFLHKTGTTVETRDGYFVTLLKVVKHPETVVFY